MQNNRKCNYCGAPLSRKSSLNSVECIFCNHINDKTDKNSQEDTQSNNKIVNDMSNYAGSPAYQRMISNRGLNPVKKNDGCAIYIIAMIFLTFGGPFTFFIGGVVLYVIWLIRQDN